MQNVYTSPDFIGFQSNFPITGSHGTGGMNTKMAAVASALQCHLVTDLADVTGSLIVEPLAIKAPRSVPEELDKGSDWKGLREIETKRIESVKKYPFRKILLCSEMELLRWPAKNRKQMHEAVNRKVYASCEYQRELFKAVGITSEVIYEPINERLFYPSRKTPKTVVAAGSAKSIKNIEMVTEVFRALEGTGFHRIFIGSPSMWVGKVWNAKETAYDLDLYHDLVEVCDEVHQASAQTTFANIISQSEFYLNFAYHEVCCRTAMEALMAGTGVVTGYHPLWKEYPVLAQVRTAEEAVKVLQAFTGDDSISPKMRDFAVNNFSYPVFNRAIERAFHES